MKLLCLSIAALAFALASCERHSWEDVKDEDGNVVEKGTKRLYEHHGHDGDHAGEGEDAKKEDGKTEAH